MLSKEYLESQQVKAIAIDGSADPDAGQTAPNGKPIWTPADAADNLMRNGVNFTFGNNGALDDGILTYGFWTFEEFLQSYYYELRYSNGEAFNNDAFYAEAYGAFEAFTAEQEAAAAAAIEMWDDLINVEFQRADSASEADITFGSVYMNPAAGAHAYYPQEEALNNAYGTTEYGKISGDVWLNWLYPEDFSGENLSPGNYGWFTLVHELGHSLGLAHGGDYNASDDNDGDGEPDPITYAGDAYFFQDSHQYTLMSYFSGRATGQAAVNWNTGYFAYAQTPAVHDILAAQNTYGADYTTRSGDTVYGFNSTADRDVFDFTVNDTPIVTIWDGGGNDTLDLSGFATDSLIDINEGAFSSAGHGLTPEYRAYFEGLGYTEADFEALYAGNGLGPDGRPTDNIAIAYGAQIENAIGGAGDDLIIGNALDNRLEGGDGDDVLVAGAGKDELIGGDGSDLFVFTHSDDVDKIRDFESGSDMIDLTAFGIDESDVKLAGRNLFADTDGDGKYDLHVVVQGDKLAFDDIAFSSADLASFGSNQSDYLLAA